MADCCCRWRQLLPPGKDDWLLLDGRGEQAVAAWQGWLLLLLLLLLGQSSP
jgi:hypothetical protein